MELVNDAVETNPNTGETTRRSDDLFARHNQFAVCLPERNPKTGAPRTPVGWARNARTVEDLVARAAKLGAVAGQPRLHEHLNRVYIPVQLKDGRTLDVEFWPWGWR